LHFSEIIRLLTNIIRHGQEEFAIVETLKELQLDYLDLFLVHWPMGNSTGNSTFDYKPVWKSMEKLVGRGTRFIGISNFNPVQLEDLLKIATIKPTVHQFELHPYLQQADYLRTNFDHNITVVAYAPLGNTNPNYSQGYYGRSGNMAPKLFTHPTIVDIAKARRCSPAQVVLAWNMARKVVVIPKAAQIAHQKENIVTLEKCKLIEADLSKIAELKLNLRVNALPCRDMKFECFSGMAGAPFCEGCTSL
jgi:alcohol dehydrogenase (NADP+)